MGKNAHAIRVYCTKITSYRTKVTGEWFSITSNEFCMLYYWSCKHILRIVRSLQKEKDKKP